MFTVVVLLYPPLWDLQSFQGSQYQFHVSEDLRIPQNFHEKGKDDVICTQRKIAFDGDGSWLAIRTLELLNYIINSIGTNHNTQKDLAECISTWLMTNAHASFEASAESSIRSWHGIKAHIRDPRNRHIDNKRMCEKLRQFTEIKLHLMDRAALNLGINPLINATSNAFGAGHVPQRKYVLQQWQRSRQSLQWIQDDIGHLLRSNESGLQIDLMNTQIEESRKAIQQAEVVKRLTALAFVFIPISTVCSAFGMNIEQLSHNLPSVWVFATVALVITVSTLICSTELAGNLFWGMLGLIHSGAVTWRAWWQNAYQNAFTEQPSFGLGVASIGANLAGVKPWKNLPGDSRMRFSNLWRIPLRAVVFLALSPFWLISTTGQRVQRLEERGKAFRAGKPI